MQLHREGSASSLTSSSSTQGRCLVTCRLRRNTFLPGEQIRGTVKLAVSSEDQDHVLVEEVTLQAHGYVKVDPRWITLPKPLRSLFEQEGKKATTTQGVPIVRYSGLDDDNTACVFASEPVVLFSRGRVERDDPATFSFSLVLPNKLTPSFRGVGVRYAYAVTVRVKRARPPPASSGLFMGLMRRRSAAPESGGVSTKDVHVAFTVLSDGLDSTARQIGNPASGIVGPGVGVAEDGGSSGRGRGWSGVAFAELEVDRQSREAFDLEAQRAKAGGLVSGTRAVTWNMQGRPVDDGAGGLTAPALIVGGGPGGDGILFSPPPMVYAIRSGDNRIGSFVLHKAEFCAGDIVLGNFDFSGASTRCLQVCACVEVCEENAFSGDTATTTPEGRKPAVGGRSTSHKRVVDSSKELTPCMVQSSVALSLPMDAPVTFATELVSVSWTLRFEFVMAPAESRWAIGGFAPSKASVLRWAIPIKVVPPRRVALAGGGGGREVGYNAMDATGRSIVC